MGIYTAQGMSHLADLTTQLYDHPFTVNTAVLRVEAGIIAMHRSMKDVALAQNLGAIEVAAQEVSQVEAEVLQDFEIILAQFLGDRETIEQVRRDFVAWKPIRDRVIQLSKAGQSAEAAAITKGEGAQYIQGLLADINDVEIFAANKAEEFLQDAQNARQQTIQITVIIAGIVTLIAIAFAFSVTQSIVRSLQQAVTLNNQLAEGKLDLTIDQDDVGKDEIGQLLGSMQYMSGRLRQIVSEVKAAAQAIAAQSENMSATATQLLTGVTEQATATEQAAASIQHMTQNIRDNTAHAQETQTTASQSADHAEKTRQSMTDAIAVMNSIIQKISIVQEVARETNMLALNASVEAVSYNDGENGFNVIANEIRLLAERTREVATSINDFADSSVATVSQAEKMLNNLVPNIQSTADLVQKISQGSTEQLLGSEQINQAVNQLNAVTRHSSEVANNLSSIAQELASHADDLNQSIAFFQLKS